MSIDMRIMNVDELMSYWEKACVFVEQHLETVYKILSVLAILSVLSIRFFLLNKTLIPSDEGWYLCLLRDCPHYGVTRFHLLFHNIFQHNIYAIRLCTYFLNVCGTAILAYGLFVYSQKLNIRHSYWVWLGFCFLGQLNIVACPSLNYITLNLIVAEFAIGLLLWGMNKENLGLFLLSGFFVGFLFPIMITNVVLIPLCVLFLFCQTNRKWLNLAFYFLGLSVFFIYYFLFVEAPQDVLGFVSNQTKDVIDRGSADYGIIFLIKWLINTGLYLFKWFLAAYLLTCIANHDSFKGHRIYHVIYVFFAIFIVYYMWEYVQPLYPTWASPLVLSRDIYWLLLFVVILQNKLWVNLRFFVIVVFMALLPVCLSFGTNIVFHVRQYAYFAFVIPAFLLSSRAVFAHRWLCLLLLFHVGMFVFSIQGTNWHGEAYLKQTEPVSKLGIEQSILVDEKYIDNLRFCKENIADGATIICGDEFWGIVALLDYKPYTYEFRIKEEQLLKANIFSALSCHKDIYVLLGSWQSDLLKWEDDIRLDRFIVNKKEYNNMLLWHIVNK